MNASLRLWKMPPTIDLVVVFLSHPLPGLYVVGSSIWGRAG